MGSQPLVKEQIEAAARIVERLGRVMPVTAAFWLHRADRTPTRWFLTIATEWATTVDGLGRARRALYDAAAGEHAWDDDHLRSSFVTPDSKVAQAALALLQQHPQLAPMRHRGFMLGDVPIEEAYLYPLPAAQPVAA